MNELLVTSDSSEMYSCTVWDPDSGTNVRTYRGGSVVAGHALSLVRNSHLIAAAKDRPLLHVWALNSSEQIKELKMIAAGKVQVLAVSPDGNWCVGGIEHKLYFWHVSSGSLLNIVSKHYDNICAIKFTADSDHVVTASSDGIVKIWHIASVVQRKIDLFFDQRLEKPLFTFSHHNLAVTDIHVGIGGLKARLYTVSLDLTLKLYSLGTGKLLLSVNFEEALTAIAVDSIDTMVFVGTSSGKILQLSLEPPPRTLDFTVADSDLEGCFLCHTKLISCLAISQDCMRLVSGSADESVIIWDIARKQPLRTIKMKGPVTNAFFTFIISQPSTHQQTSTVISKFEKNIQGANWKRNFVEVTNFKESHSFNELDLSKDQLLNFNTVESMKFEENDNQINQSSNTDEVLKEELQTSRVYNKNLYTYALHFCRDNPMFIAQKLQEQKGGFPELSFKKNRKRAFPKRR